MLTLRVKRYRFGIFYYKHFDTPCHLYPLFATDTECQNVYNKKDQAEVV
jgi:hypothetical protein